MIHLNFSNARQVAISDCEWKDLIHVVLTHTALFQGWEVKKAITYGCTTVSPAAALAGGIAPPSAWQEICAACEKKDLDYFAHDSGWPEFKHCFTFDVVAKEQGRWQEAIYQLLRKHSPRPDDIDGSGCDSGDPLDLSLSEIESVLCELKDLAAPPPPPPTEPAK